MKKGCFLSAITIVTLLVMAGIYFYKINEDSLKGFTKEKIIDMAADELQVQINNIKESTYKDSLQIVLAKSIKEIKEENIETAMKRLGLITEKIKLVINDSVLDSTEFAEVKATVKNERSKKN